MMTITLPPEMADYYTKKAQEAGMKPEDYVLQRLREIFGVSKPSNTILDQESSE